MGKRKGKNSNRGMGRKDVLVVSCASSSEKNKQYPSLRQFVAFVCSSKCNPTTPTPYHSFYSSLFSLSTRFCNGFLAFICICYFIDFFCPYPSFFYIVAIQFQYLHKNQIAIVSISSHKTTLINTLSTR